MQKAKRNPIVIATWSHQGQMEWGHNIANDLSTCGSTKLCLRSKREPASPRTDWDEAVCDMYLYVWFSVDSASVSIDLRCEHVRGSATEIKRVAKYMEELERKIRRKFPLDGFVTDEPAAAILWCLKAAGISERVVYPALYSGADNVYRPVEGLAVRVGEWIKAERERLQRRAA